jgi:hypothetical protein
MEENIAVKMARKLLYSERKKHEEDKMTIVDESVRKREYRPRRARCVLCDGKYPRQELDENNLCPMCSGKDKPISGMKENPIKKEIVVRHSHAEIPMKRCFFCEGNSFNIFQTGIIRCTQCGVEFQKK